MSTEDTHKDNSTDWNDEDRLRRLYQTEKQSIQQIADNSPVTFEAIRYWMKEHGIERREPSVPIRYEGAAYRDEDTLRELYHTQGMTTRDVADELDCDSATVIRWMEKHDIERRDRETEARKATAKPYARCITSTSGYEVWRDNGKDIKGEYTVRVHRLLAVAEHGLDSLDGMLVHHKNNCSWDNRASNLELMDPSEHTTMHQRADYTPDKEV